MSGGIERATKCKSPLKREGKAGKLVAEESLYAHNPCEEGTLQGRHSALHIALEDSPRATLQGWLRQPKTPLALAKRARAILLLADGQTFAATARQVAWRERHVRTWALRFLALGLEGLYDTKRPGRKPGFPPGGDVVRGHTGV